MADILPLPREMRLMIKGREVKHEEPRNEERFLRFPAIQEPWEVSCGSDEDWEEQAPANEKADPKAGLYDIAS